MKKNLFLLFLVCFNSAAFAQFKNSSITTYTPKKNNKVVLVDVRTPAEYQEGHLPNAQNIDWFSPAFASGFEGLKKRQKIYVYCRSGKRSAKAAALLDSLGFKRVINLQGGYNAYKAKFKE